MNTSAVAALACLWLAAVPAGAQAGDDRALVSETVRALFRAAEQKQLERLEAFHDFGPAFSKFDEFGLGREDGPVARASERQALASVKKFHADVRELRVDVFGRAAVATFILAYEADTGAGVATSQLRSTIVCAKRGKSWKVVHEHYSRLAGEP